MVRSVGTHAKMGPYRIRFRVPSSAASSRALAHFWPRARVRDIRGAAPTTQKHGACRNPGLSVAAHFTRAVDGGALQPRRVMQRGALNPRWGRLSLRCALLGSPR